MVGAAPCMSGCALGPLCCRQPGLLAATKKDCSTSFASGEWGILLSALHKRDPSACLALLLLLLLQLLLPLLALLLVH